MIANKLAMFDAEALAAIRAGERLADAKLQTLAEFTSRLFEARGLIAKEDARVFFNAGFQEQQILEIILAMSVKTLSN